MGPGVRRCSGVRIRHYSNRRGRSSRCMAWLTLTSMTSLREALFVLVVVALASMTITFHLGHYLNPLQQTPNDSDDAISGGSNHLNVHRSLHLSQQRRGGGGGGGERPTAEYVQRILWRSARTDFNTETS
ncbi:hypothetical protein BaRGS_00015142 [Batillaria attramentaria]|uniref:Uncharacterized protein n=1 Tax=Batillaria attramentaria TaxID=370345 RepID=A0ABD0L3D2_9CAEN